MSRRERRRDAAAVGRLFGPDSRPAMEALLRRTTESLKAVAPGCHVTLIFSKHAADGATADVRCISTMNREQGVTVLRSLMPKEGT